MKINNLKDELIKKFNLLKNNKLLNFKSKNIVNNITTDEYYNNEEILKKSFDDITTKILDNIEDIDVSELKFPKKKFDCVFMGGGLKGYYLFGAIIILRKMINNKQIKIRNFICVSIGALAAVFLLSGISIHKMRNIYEFARNNNKYDLNKITLKVCDELLPDNVHELCNGRVKILVSKLTLTGMKQEIISKFKSKKDLLGIIHATSCIPYFTNKNILGVKINDNIYYDGAFTNNLPILKNNDIPQLIFHTNNVEYTHNYIFNTNDKCPELLILRGVIEMEKFIKQLSSNDSHNKDILNVNKNIPIEWINKNIEKTNVIFFEKMITKILIITGYIISLTANTTNIFLSKKIKN